MNTTFLNFVNERFNPNSNFFGWITGDNRLIKVPEMGHVNPLKKEFPHIKGDIDLYIKAYDEDWVRLHYRSQHHVNGEMALTANRKERIKEVLNLFFRDTLETGRKKIIIVWGDKDKYEFYTNDMNQISNGYPKVKFIWDFLDRNNEQIKIDPYGEEDWRDINDIDYNGDIIDYLEKINNFGSDHPDAVLIEIFISLLRKYSNPSSPKERLNKIFQQDLLEVLAEMGVNQEKIDRIENDISVYIAEYIEKGGRYEKN